ncbi:hypothetical protein BDN70DRAFT_874303 [Pholiota conissans]|uniref:BTB domain-containing protein n=1 Tax=Pholiota conissans TaxID=109636 RepID=A0A9P5ZAC8_9AGAR|nr:hypothetical protein BDN70DRAFT_874303 [Pholiota conissans]
MSLLHDYFNTRNLQGFRRLLDNNAERGSTTSAPSSGTPGSSYTGGGGKSWTRNGGVTNGLASTCEVNARDWLGRTALHLACNAVENIEYVQALLKHPSIDVNLPDTESFWTPLHRALYAANLPVALLLLQRPEIDTSLKDLEGYTAFDLYNSTVNGTKPISGATNAELYTWGANHNAALGLADGNDRTYPDHVNIQSKESPAAWAKLTLAARFSPIRVRQVQMSKLHTVVVTSESEGNLRLCGFGSGGRLGPAQHTQYNLNPLPSFNLDIVSVALGQDHTLVLTKSGEVYSWGLNRFSQLGYVVETSSSGTGRIEEPIQSVPKRVVGFLRKEVVRGVAASKNASACWTKDTVFTWGTNTGQLGYDKNAQPIQITPRPVTKFSNIVIELSMSDTVLVGLLVTRHVECIWNDVHYRISFPLNSFPTGIEPYRPPLSVRDSLISKVTCCDDTFAALSLNGEVFTFTPPKSTGDNFSREGRAFAPQRVWALRKKFSAVKDVALGSEGSLIICTESGHAFIRTRNAKSASAKAFKFERVPFLQRVIQVCANSTGAFGALRVDYQPKPIDVIGNSLARDMKFVQPYLEFYRTLENEDEKKNDGQSSTEKVIHPDHFDDEPEDIGIESDVADVASLCDVIFCEQRMRKRHGGTIDYGGIHLPHGADTMIHLQSGEIFPAHRVVLAARSRIFASILSGSGNTTDDKANTNIKLLSAKPGPGLGVTKISRIAISQCQPLSILILLRYLYSDEVLAVWDRRIGAVVVKQISALGVDLSQVKAELQTLAKMLDLPALIEALQAPVKRVPTPTMATHMIDLFEGIQKLSSRTSPLAPDVVLQFVDKDVYTHSVLLRSRSPLFANFFDLEDWTKKRWAADGMVRVDMRHLKSHVMEFVLKFMCCDGDEEMFRYLEFVKSTEELIPFMFGVLAGANEFHLDRLILLCSDVILRYTNVGNACYVLADATHYRIQPLINKLQDYISINLETFLECRLLDDIPYALVKQLSKFTRRRQTEKSPYSRGGAYIQSLLDKYGSWLALQDIPQPTLKHTTIPRKDISSNKLSPPVLIKRSTSNTSSSTLVPPPSPRAVRRLPSGDDIFLMDEPELQSGSSKPIESSPVWKAQGTAPKVDMKMVMAEAAAATQSKPQPVRLPVTSRASTSKVPLPRPNEPSTPTKISPRTDAPLTWRAIPKPNVEPIGSHSEGPSVQSTPPSMPSNTTPVKSMLSGTRPPASPSPSVSRASQSLGAPGLGPVITPTRQMPLKSSSPQVRNVIGGKAWTLPPVQPIAEPSPPARGMSFVAIQYSQQEQFAPVKDKRSLREIQEEEHALQEEADFLKWWTAEEERVKQETLALAQMQNIPNKKSNARKPRPPKQKADSASNAAGPSTSHVKEQGASSSQGPRKPRKPRQKNPAAES